MEPGTRFFNRGARKSEVSLEIEKSKSLAERRSCCETARLGDNSKKDRDFATIKTPSNSSAGLSKGGCLGRAASRNNRKHSVVQFMP